MKKKTYNRPQIEITRFEVEDILTTSTATDVPGTVDTLTYQGVFVGDTKSGNLLYQ